MGCSLQRRTSAQRTRSRCPWPSRRTRARLEARIPTSVDTGCARASKVRAGQLAPRVLRLGDAGAPVMEYGPLNRMTEDAEVLRSGVAPTGRHFCGAQASGVRQMSEKSIA